MVKLVYQIIKQIHRQAVLAQLLFQMTNSQTMGFNNGFKLVKPVYGIMEQIPCHMSQQVSNILWFIKPKYTKPAIVFITI